MYMKCTRVWVDKANIIWIIKNIPGFKVMSMRDVVNYAIQKLVDENKSSRSAVSAKSNKKES
jgi:hypothetical protein